MTTFGMITDSNSGEVTQIRYAEALRSWTTTQLSKQLAAVRAQLPGAYQASFAEESNLRDFQLGLMTELRRRDIEIA